MLSSPLTTLTIPPIVRRCLPRVTFGDDLPLLPDDRTEQVMGLIAHCRHGELGAKQFYCEVCDHSQIRLRSCGDRHCPTCSGRRRYLWHEGVIGWKLHCGYLHNVTTLPHHWNDLVAANPGVLLRWLMTCSRRANARFASQRFGVAHPGSVMTLHTWGQRLLRHYHVHTIQTAGGLSEDWLRWIGIDPFEAERLRGELAAMFKAIFLPGVRKMIKRGELRMPASLSGHGTLSDMLEKVEAIDWVADVQGPGKDHRDGAQLVGYLAAYVTGSAIGNGRLISDSGGMITFNVRDYRSGTRMTETLYETEFVKRMSYHVLPRGMQRTRYAGLFRGQGRQTRLDHCRKLLGEPSRDHDDRPNSPTTVLMPGETEEEPRRVSFVACEQCDRPMDVSETLAASDTMSMLAVAAGVVARITEAVEETFRQSLQHVVAERRQRGSRNPIILGLSSGLISYEDPIVKWVSLWVEQTIKKDPPPKSSPRGPPADSVEVKA